MAVINQPKTLAYFEGVQGWPSHYSWIPDGMISLNNRFFSFRDGTIWEHNAEPSVVPRNQFYDDPFTLDESSTSASKPSMIQFIFNDVPTAVWNWKTLEYVGSGTWRAEVFTDTESRIIDDSVVPNVFSPVGRISAFREEEGNFYGDIGGVNETDISDIDLKASNIVGLGAAMVNSGVLTFPSVINDLVSLGDDLYFFTNTGTAQSPVYSNELRYAGVVGAKTDNTLSISTSASFSIDGPAGFVSNGVNYKMYINDFTGTIGDAIFISITQAVRDAGIFTAATVSLIVTGAGQTVVVDNIPVDGIALSTVLTNGESIRIRLPQAILDSLHPLGTDIPGQDNQSRNRTFFTADQVRLFINTPSSAVSLPPNSSLRFEASTPSSSDFFLFSKDKVFETSGVLGNVAIVTMTNIDNVNKAEIFSVATNAFESAP